jgi:S1-C subfamily serine protease
LSALKLEAPRCNTYFDDIPREGFGSWSLVMRTALVSVSFLLGLVVPVFSQDRLTPELLQSLKAATPFITTGEGARQRSGSGILIHVKGETGLVATNAHVLSDGETEPANVTCVLHSGTAKELKVPAKLKMLDFRLDLALLEISGSNLPEPISLQKPAEVFETLPVYTVGFPLGQLLGLQQAKLNHTISRASVSSIRTNAQDEAELYQLDGGLNPGNSGGPIVDVSGKLVGMAVAKVRGTEIGFAIPVRNIATLLEGSAQIREINLGEYDLRGQPAEFVVNVSDPLNKLKEVRCYVFRSAEYAKQVAERKPLPSGRIAPPDVKPIVLDVSTGQARTTATIPLAKDPPTWLQLAIVVNDGKELFARPDLVAPNLRKPPKGWSTTEPNREWNAVKFAAPNLEAAKSIPLTDKLTGVTPAGGGRFLVLQFAEQQKARLLDLSTGAFSGEVPFPTGAHLAAGRDELLVGPINGKLQAWSLPDLKALPPRNWKRTGTVLALHRGWNSTEPLLAVMQRALGGEQRIVLD